MRTFSTMRNYTSDDEDKPIETTKLHRRSLKQQKRPVAGPRRGTKMMRSMRYWFGMCWGRGKSEDGESVGERERLLDHGKAGCDEERWDSDKETEFEEEDGDDERLMGVRVDDGKMVGEEEQQQCKKGEGKRWKGVLRGVRKCSRWS